MPATIRIRRSTAAGPVELPPAPAATIGELFFARNGFVLGSANDLAINDGLNGSAALLVGLGRQVELGGEQTIGGLKTFGIANIRIAGGTPGQVLTTVTGPAGSLGWGVGGPDPSNSLPLVNGIANAGNSPEYSRANHVHPTDTSRIAKAGGDGIMSGLLTLSGPPVDNLHAATKLYVDQVRTALGDYLPLDGGTLHGDLVIDADLEVTGDSAFGGVVMLNADPTLPLQAATKNYVDLYASGHAYQGTWEVEANDPNILPPYDPQPGYFFMCRTADPSVPELAPPGLAGIGGMLLAEGDVIRWNGVLNLWQAVHAGGLARPQADLIYLQLTGGALTGALNLPTTGYPTLPAHATTKAYVDTFLPLAGGTMGGNLIIDGGSLTVEAPGTINGIIDGGIF
jgi:hypothetical protein